MNENICKKELSHGVDYSGTLDRIKDHFTHGVALHVCYKADWKEIRETFKLVGPNLDTYGPILTINSLKNVRLALKLCKNPRGYMQKDVFLNVLSSLPIYCRHSGINTFENFMDTIEFSKIMDLNGTMKDKDKEIEQIIEPLFLDKKKNLKTFKKEL